MTILPTKRSGTSSEDKNEPSQNVNTERSRRDHTSSISDPTKAGPRRSFRRSATPETSDHCLRKRFKESSKPRRKQPRERKRVEKAPEETLETVNTASDSNQPIPESVDPTDDTNADPEDDATGFNSEDEYVTPVSVNHLTEEEWARRDDIFARCISDLGYEIKQMSNDGACLFRAIADQIYGDQELHYMVRTACMDYIVKNRDFFASYMTEDFDKYVARKRKWYVHGNHLEIHAMSEMYNRTIEVYCYEIEPINIFNVSRNADEPIRLSYHRMCHYNSISNPNKPSVGVGLGLPSYHTNDLNRRRMVDAVRASEDLLIEQTMLEDKIKATDWEATSEAMEEEIARESYIQYFRDCERRQKQPQGHAKASSSSTVTSAMLASPRPTLRRGSASPKGGSVSPKGGSSPRPGLSSHSTSMRNSPRSSGSSTSLCSNNNEFCSSASNESYKSPSQSPKRQIYDLENMLKMGCSYSSVCDCTGKSEDSNSKSDAECSTGPVLTTEDMISEEDWDERIMAQVMAESCKSYFDDLKRNSKKIGSPGPSTSR